MRVRIFFFGVAIATAAHGQAWVSAASGNDTNTCLRNAPCKTFQRAVNSLGTWGSVGVLDPGDYGSVSINKSVTIDGGGMAANIAVTGSAITVQAGTWDVVQIRNMVLHGNGASYGINYSSGAQLVVENLKVNGFGTNCINAALTVSSDTDLVIKDTSVDNCSNYGIYIGGNPNLTAELSKVRVHYANNGLGVFSGNVTVTTSEFSSPMAYPGYSAIGVQANGGQVSLDNSQVSGFYFGIYTNNGTLLSSRNTVSYCVIGFDTSSSGTSISFNNNVVFNNSANGGFTHTYATY